MSSSQLPVKSTAELQEAVIQGDMELSTFVNIEMLRADVESYFGDWSKLSDGRDNSVETSTIVVNKSEGEIPNYESPQKMSLLEPWPCISLKGSFLIYGLFFG
ncbi:hypothetical protein TorRG33x02_166260 [Trema orientale]|uniref:Uncharacterized protein n=1 Tax=Trema orientale TaxID=63057 RepID=A0A2P5EQ01_TREOI|nr:hypothetical protein TorRG33x02_166260 [Trema orientale]